MAGDLFNSGTIAGREFLAIGAENIQNLQGRILGNEVALAARTDLDNIGGLIAANESLLVSAGRDLTIASTTRTQENAQGSRTNIERVAALYVTGADGSMQLSAGRDLALVAADLQSRGEAILAAGNDLTLGSVTESQRNHIVWDAQNQRSDASSAEIGSRVQAQGDLALRAGNDLQARAASVTSSQGDLRVSSGGNIQLEAGLANVQVDEAHQHTGRSSAFSSKTITTRDTLDQTTALASTFSGDTITVLAGNDLAVTGSNLVSDAGTTLAAGRDLVIEAATETQTESHFRDEKKSGIFSAGGLGITIGTQQQSVDQQGVSQTAAASTVGSLQGDVTLLAGERYRQTGSDVLAPQGDVSIAAQTVDILEARETADSRVEQKFKQSGLTVAITSPVVSAIQTVAQMKSAASQTNDSRMQALAVASAGLAVHQGYNAVSAGQGQTITAADGTVKDNQIITGKDANGDLTSRDATAMDKVGGVNLSISLGSSKSSSTSTQTADTAAGSTVAAGRDVTIVATGAGEQSDITVQGSTVQGGRNVNLIAEDEIKLLAAANTAELHSNNQSSSGSIGVSIGTSGFAVTASASKGKGHADGQDTAWTNTKIGAGETASLASGGDTSLKGAVVEGQRVIADVGGNLAIESLQDTSTYDSKQSSSGFSISIPISGGVPDLKGIGGSIGGGKSQIDSDYASVTEQSAIRAGDGGFDVQVGADTTLTGGAITSTQQAIDEGKNRFATGGSLTLSDIENKAEYVGRGASINIGAGISTDGKLAPQGTSAGIGEDSGSASSMTLAAISGIAGHKDARTGDAETGIAPIFDAEKVQKEIDAQVQITQVFGQQASKAVGDYAEQQLRQASILRAEGKEDEANAIEAQWGANGTLRLAAHTVIGGLTGGASGAAGAAAGTLTAPAVADALANANIDGPLATTLTGLASTAAGALAGGSAGAATAFNEVANNYLSHSENLARALARKDCANGNESSCQKADELDALDKRRDAEYHTACGGELRTTPGCAEATQTMFGALGTYVGINPGEKTGDFAAEHRNELQSYLDLIKTASPDVRTSTDSGIQAPNAHYDPDPYGVVDKDNKKDAYLVMKFDDKLLAVGKVNDENGNYAILTPWWARNGMLNEPSYATWLMFTHVEGAAQEKAKASGADYLPVDRYTLSYAPTNGFMSDIWGALLTKSGSESESVLGLRSQMEAIAIGNQAVDWVVHSRGGVEFVQAAQGSSEKDLSQNSVVFHAGANTKWTTDAMMINKGIGDVIDRDRRYLDAPNDLVPQLVGLRALTAPWNIVPALIYAPCLSSVFCSVTQSPHTLPYQGNNPQLEGK